MTLLRLYHLAAMNTMFKPKKHQSVHTFLQTKRKDADVQNDKYIGRETKAKYKGHWVHGKVIEPSLISKTPAWIVRFDDDYLSTFTEKQLKKILIHVKTKKNDHQLDYICFTQVEVVCTQIHSRLETIETQKLVRRTRRPLTTHKYLDMTNPHRQAKTGQRLHRADRKERWGRRTTTKRSVPDI